MPETQTPLLDVLVAKARKRIFLDIGSGPESAQNCEPGWTRLDIFPFEGVDIVHNIVNVPWPFADESVRAIRCYHVLEHIPMTCACCADRPDPLLQIFDEMWRILEPGGVVRVASPHAANISRAWRDPTHRRAITEETFAYANIEGRQKLRVAHYPIVCDFSLSWTFTFDEHAQPNDLQMTMTKPGTEYSNGSTL